MGSKTLEPRKGPRVPLRGNAGLCAETEGLVRGSVEGSSVVQVMDEPVSSGDPSEGPLWGGSLSRKLRIPP